MRKVAVGVVLSIVSLFLPAKLFPQTPRTGNEQDLTRRMQDMRGLEGYARRRSEKDRKEMESLHPPELDKKTKDRIRQARMIDTADVERYRAFLGDKNAGIFKIFPNSDCLTENVIRVDADCANFVPESSNFSFREVAYTHPLYHDIGFENGEFVSQAFFAAGAMTTLGNVPIEDITLGSPALKYLRELQPDMNVAGAKRTISKFKVGVDHDGTKYSSSVAAAVDTTYALRVTAFNIPNSLPPVSPDLSLIELKFLGLSQDKRDDVLVVFRVIRKDENGGLTVVWKELSRKPAPKLKFGKGEALADLK